MWTLICFKLVNLCQCPLTISKVTPFQEPVTLAMLPSWHYSDFILLHRDRTRIFQSPSIPRCTASNPSFPISLPDEGQRPDILAPSHTPIHQASSGKSKLCRHKKRYQLLTCDCSQHVVTPLSIPQIQYGLSVMCNFTLYWKPLQALCQSCTIVNMMRQLLS